MQTLERSRMLITRQRTRRTETEIDSSLLSGRVTRSRLKDLNQPKDMNNDIEGTKQGSSVFKDSSQIQLENERLKKQEKIEDERSAREQRRQKRLMRNELPTSKNKDDFVNIDWSSREIIRELTRVKAIRKKEKKNRRKRTRAKHLNRNRRGSINTDEETDLFDHPEDFEWPGTDPIIQQNKKATNRGRQVTKPENFNENETEGLKIMMEANMYRLLGIQKQGLEEMKIFCNKEEYFKKSQVAELKDKIWIKGEWVLSENNSRSRMEYIKNKDL